MEKFENFGRKLKTGIRNTVMGAAAFTSMAAHAEAPKTPDAKDPAAVVAPAPEQSSVDATVVTPELARQERQERLKADEENLRRQIELESAHLAKLIEIRDGVFSEFDTANHHVQQYLSLHGEKRSAKTFAESLGLPSAINAQIITFVGDPQNGGKDFLAKESLTNLESYLLSYDNPQNGKMVEAMQSVLNGHNIASMLGADSGDKVAHNELFGSIGSRIIKVCVDVETARRHISELKRQMNDLSGQEADLLAEIK